ncbi:MAG: hypothetical protein Q4E10_01550 [Porphyromonas sp.]|nr:hypothetical protein [Porphyromonas sp.]
MKKKFNHWRSRIAALVLVLLGGVGLTNCKTTQKNTVPQKKDEPRHSHRLDSLPDHYGEVIAMYGTPYKPYEPKREVPPVKKEIR